jgi:hypothetical protein
MVPTSPDHNAIAQFRYDMQSEQIDTTCIIIVDGYSEYPRFWNLKSATRSDF